MAFELTSIWLFRRNTQQVMCYCCPQVLWFLASDSLRARRAAKQRYGDKLITDTEAKAVHVVCVDRVVGCGRNSSRKAAAMQVNAS